MVLEQQSHHISKTKHLIVDFCIKKADTDPLNVKNMWKGFLSTNTWAHKPCRIPPGPPTSPPWSRRPLHLLAILGGKTCRRSCWFFYCCSIDSVLAYCMSTGHTSCLVADKKASRGSPTQEIFPGGYIQLLPIFGETPLTLNIICSHCCPLANASRLLNFKQIDSKTVFTPLQFVK